MTPQEISEYCYNMTPMFYAGVRDKTIEDHPLFFRDFIFTNQLNTDREIMTWDEIQNDHRAFMPPTVAPCDDITFVPDSDDFDRHFAKFSYWQQGYNVDCNFNHQIGPGESCLGDTSLAQAIDRSFARKQAKVERGFRLKEELWSALLVCKEKVTIDGPTIKAYDMEFKRHDSLNEQLTGGEVWGGADSTAMANIEYMDSALFARTGGMTTDILMTPEACKKFRQSKDVQECLKAYQPQLFIGSSLLADQGREPKAPFRGAKRQFVLGETNIQVWCLNSKMTFCDPSTGKDIDIRLMDDDKIIGLDLSAGDTGYGGTFAYGGIQNMQAGANRAQTRFANQWASQDGKSLKGSVESAPLPLVMCADASWSLNIGDK